MIINFDSNKQLKYWCLGFILLIVFPFLQDVFDFSFPDEVADWYVASWCIWIVLGKYILRYLFKID